MCIEDLPFEMGGMQCIGVAEQQEVIVGGEILEHRNDVWPQVEKHSLPCGTDLLE